MNLTRVEIAEEADVVVSWQETNQTSDIPVARISTDGGQTFGLVINIGTNGTLTTANGNTSTTTANEEEQKREQSNSNRIQAESIYLLKRETPTLFSLSYVLHSAHELMTPHAVM